MAAAASGPGASGPLAALADVSLPPAVPWMPQTPAWAVLGVALLLVALWAARRAVRRYRANRYRREALAELSLLAQRIDVDDAQRAQALARSSPRCSSAPRWPRGPARPWLHRAAKIGGASSNFMRALRKMRRRRWAAS